MGWLYDLMLKFLAKARIWLIHNPMGKTVLLFVVPHYVLPEMFKPEHRGRNLFVKISGVVSAPISAATFCTSAFGFYAGNTLNATLAKKSELSNVEYYEFIGTVSFASSLFVGGIALVCVYALSLYLWGNHKAWVAIFKRMKHPTNSAPFAYFLLMTSSRALWFGVFIFLAGLVIPSVISGEVDPIFSAIHAYPFLTTFVIIILMWLQQRKEWVESVSMRQMYGSTWAGFFVSLSHLVPLFTTLLLFRLAV